MLFGAADASLTLSALGSGDPLGAIGIRGLTDDAARIFGNVGRSVGSRAAQAGHLNLDAFAINTERTANIEIVGPYLELGSREAIAAQRAYKQSLNSQEALVVGRLDDTAAGAELGMQRLNDPDWTINVNDAWIQGGIDGGKSFYLGSSISFQNLRSGNPLYPKTVFFRELQQLRDAGYYRQGDLMLPPPRP